ncbi:hypothetical protein [Corynebacterium aquilae]|nr:hypothetical protein [Corynebacterium aquilae]
MSPAVAQNPKGPSTHIAECVAGAGHFPQIVDSHVDVAWIFADGER